MIPLLMGVKSGVESERLRHAVATQKASGISVAVEPRQIGVFGNCV